MKKRIAVISGKGGVGKSTITACLGDALAREGHRVTVMDADFGLRDLDLLLGKENDVFYNSVDVMYKACKKKEALLPVSENLYLMPASQHYSWDHVHVGRIDALMNKLTKKMDYLLIDMPAGIGTSFKVMKNYVDAFLLVIEPTWPSVRDAQKVLQVCRDYHIRQVDIVVNQTAAESPLSLEDVLYSAMPCDTVGTIFPYVPQFRQEDTVFSWQQQEAFATMMEPLLDAVVRDEAWGLEAVASQYEAVCEAQATQEATVAVKPETVVPPRRPRLLERQRQSRWHRRYR